MASARPLGYILRVFVTARRPGLAALLAAAAIGIGGCSGSDEPRTLPPLSTTPAATSSSVSSQQDELKAATAVVRQYFRLLSAETNNATAEALERLTTSDCACRRTARSIRAAAAKHERYVGSARIKQVVPALDSHAQVEVLLTYDSTPGGLIDSNGRYIERVSAVTGTTLNFYVVARNGGWVIRQVITIHEGTKQ